MIQMLESHRTVKHKAVERDHSSNKVYHTKKRQKCNRQATRK